MHMPSANLLMPPWTPLGEARALPRLWPGFAQTCHTLAGPAWPLPLPAGPATLQLCPSGPAHWTEAIALRLRWRGHDGELALDEAAQARCLGDVPADAPLAWRQILLADALHGAARALMGSVPEWEPAAAPWPRDASSLWCAVVGTADGAAPGHARLRWNAAPAWAAFAEAVGRCAHWPAGEGNAVAPTDETGHATAAAASRARRARLRTCRVPLRLELGRTRLDLASLRHIAPGDIVAVDEWRPRGPALGVQLYAGRRGELQWAAEVRQTRLTVLTATEPLMPDRPGTSRVANAPGASSAHSAPGTPSQPPASAPPVAQAIRVADSALPIEQLQRLEVTLHFDLGGLALSLEALERVAAGQVLELPQALNQCELSILCEERLLGKGQLVAVGERLGVRVTEFAVGDHAAPA
jgi:type III secretion protein Q